MNKKLTILIIGILLISLFLIVGCGEEKKQISAKQTTTPATTETKIEDKEVETKADAPEKSGGEYELEYCNKFVGDLRSDIKKTEENVAENKQELNDLNSDLKSADSDDRESMQAAVDNKEAAISAFEESLTQMKSSLSDLEDDCDSYKSNCDAFKARTQEEFDDATNEFGKEQMELQYTAADRIDIQKRKVALWQIRIDNWSNILDDLNAKC